MILYEAECSDSGVNCALGDGACDERYEMESGVIHTFYRLEGTRVGDMGVRWVFIGGVLIQTAMVRLESDFKLYVSDLTTFPPKK